MVRGRCTRRILWFEEDANATLRFLEVTSRWPEPLVLRVVYEHKTYEVRTQLHGRHMVVPVQTVMGEDGVTFVRDDWKAPL